MSTSDIGSGPVPETCTSFTSRAECIPQCWWCDDANICVNQWKLCESQSVGSNGGPAPILVPLVVLVLVLGGGAMLSFLWGEGSMQSSDVEMVREGFEGSSQYRRSHYRGLHERERPEHEAAFPPVSEGERLLSNVCE